MISHLTPTLWEEVDRWRRNSGLELPPSSPKPLNRARTRASHKIPGRKGHNKADSDREGRDWDKSAKKLEPGHVDMSHGDPLFRLMQYLVPWWKQRFRITAPGLRKRGYMPMERLDRLIKAHKTEFDDAQRFGERIPNIEAFRKHAQNCQGSRDVGSQLFTALLRGLGLEARLVSNLQCLGFGWNKFEDAEPEEMGKDGLFGAKENRDRHKSSKPSYKKATKPMKEETARKTRTRNKTRSFNDMEMDLSPKKGQTSTRRFDLDLEYPHYWTEVLSPVTNKYLPVESTVKGVVATNRDLVESLAPRAKDLTIRYLKKQMFPGRTKGARMPMERIPIYNHNGKVKRYEQIDWFKSVMAGYIRGTKKHPVTEADELEDSTDLMPAKPEKKEVKEGQETLQYYKQSKEFVLERHLKREEALKPEASPVKIFKNKTKGGKVEDEDVYLRTDVLQVKSAETWHKQGRAPLSGEKPLKRVPYRAATLNRRREILEAEAATGEKVLQGLYSHAQTDWIIPPPIKNGVIPKNGYGNIDLFAEHMCPKGAVHVPYRGAVRVCKRLQIDYAEAVVDFEFGHRMAVPVIRGVVIAEEYYDQLIVELEKDEAERARKEDEKRRKTVLGRWRKFIMGLRIVERIRQDYGDIDEDVLVLGHEKKSDAAPESDADMGGGFLPEGYEEEEEPHVTSSFFPAGDSDDENDGNGDGGLIMEVENDGHAPEVADSNVTQRALKETGKKSVKGTKARGESSSTRMRTRSQRKLARIYDGEEERGSACNEDE
ncbi:hypothetical protein CDD81_5916 [Ophiocordyceps australis]|uniref:Rad4 beta-hairpin domain-containing protein n=1 Tax=Ophiocordyceps australis TaxID=1399860 RepID=A0A2C5YIH7_9HYPO|nr:hypothetical protein CDD81_5916 [Ophiocordyceps australis]